MAEGCKVCGRKDIVKIGYGCCPADYRLAKKVGWDIPIARSLRQLFPVGRHIPREAIFRALLPKEKK